MKITAVLLTGGESRRMGKDKATILFGSKPLWKNQLDLLRKLKLAEIFVSARTDPAWRPADIRFVADGEPSHGPLSGLVAAMARMSSTHLLTLAVDMPFMTAQCLQRTCNRIHSGCGIVPMIGNRAEPLAAIYPTEAFSDFTAALQDGDFSLQTVTRQLIGNGKLVAVKVPTRETKFYRNLNQPADLFLV